MKKIIILIVLAVVIFFEVRLIFKLPDVTSYIPVGNNSRKATKLNGILVYDAKKNEEIFINLEEYLVGVVAQEMPADFELEALKAQAVAARTFSIGRMKKIYGDRLTHPNSDICTDFNHCQAYIEKKDFIKDYYNKTGELKWEKIQRAVYSTRDIVITYNGKLVNPLYHSNSGGLTEAASDVWDGLDVPYLKSVSSFGEDLGYKFNEVKIINAGEFLKKLGIKGKFVSKAIVKSIAFDRSPTGRVKYLEILGVKKKGTEIRSLYGLSSTNFSIVENNGEIHINTHGFGHGVGMSQCGANYLAINQANYCEILKHYYQGVELQLISDVE